MYGWVVEMERFFNPTNDIPAHTPPTAASVGAQVDAWCERAEQQCADAAFSEQERTCLTAFVKVTRHLRPHLCQCYGVSGLPRTNNDLEDFIRATKARARRISGRKNWNRYLLRYGRRVAYYEAAVRMGTSTTLAAAITSISPTRWRTARREQQQSQAEQLTQARFRRNRSALLQQLEDRWVAATTCT